MQAFSRFVLPLVDLRLKFIHLFPHLVDHLLLKLAVLHLTFGVVGRVFLFESCGAGIVLPDPNRNVLHLELVLTFLSLALQWLLTDRFNLQSFGQMPYVDKEEEKKAPNQEAEQLEIEK